MKRMLKCHYHHIIIHVCSQYPTQVGQDTQVIIFVSTLLLNQSKATIV